MNTTPKTLRSTEDITFTYAYQPEKELIGLFGKVQDITVYPPPLFVFSPGMRIYDAKSIRKYKGYISSVVPSDIIEGEEPTAVMTISPTITEGIESP